MGCQSDSIMEDKTLDIHNTTHLISLSATESFVKVDESFEKVSRTNAEMRVPGFKYPELIYWGNSLRSSTQQNPAQLCNYESLFNHQSNIA